MQQHTQSEPISQNDLGPPQGNSFVEFAKKLARCLRFVLVSKVISVERTLAAVVAEF